MHSSQNLFWQWTWLTLEMALFRSETLMKQVLGSRPILRFIFKKEPQKLVCQNSDSVLPLGFPSGPIKDT